jgi:hypothetical protein
MKGRGCAFPWSRRKSLWMNDLRPWAPSACPDSCSGTLPTPATPRYRRVAVAREERRVLLDLVAGEPCDGVPALFSRRSAGSPLQVKPGVVQRRGCGSSCRIRKKNGPHAESAESAEFSRAARCALECIHRSGFAGRAQLQCRSAVPAGSTTGFPRGRGNGRRREARQGAMRIFFGRGCGLPPDLQGAWEQDVRTT